MLNKSIKFLIENKLIAALLLVLLIGWGLINAPFNWDLKDFNKHRQGYYDSNDLFISKYRYNIYWLLKQPTVSHIMFFESNLLDNFINDEKRYFFIGDKKDLSDYNKIIKIEDYSFSNGKKDTFSIWRIYLKK